MAQKLSLAASSSAAASGASGGPGGKGARASPQEVSWSVVAASLPPIADLFTDTTVLFSDIVGFTAWSSSVTAVDVFEARRRPVRGVSGGDSLRISAAV